MLSSRKIRKWISFLAVVAVFWAVGNFVIPHESITYSVKDGQIGFYYATSVGFRSERRNCFTIDLADIVSCSLVQVDRNAPLLEGADTMHCRYGTIKFSGGEILSVCLYKKPDRAVRIQTQNGSGYLVSFIDNDNTNGFYEGLQKLIEHL